MNKKLTYSIIIALFLLCIAAFVFTFRKDAKYKTIFTEASESYHKGAINEAWTKVKDYSEGVILLDEGCELLISASIQTDHLTEAENFSRKCIELKKGNGIAQEALAMILVKDSKIEEASAMLQKESQLVRNSRIYAALARVALLQNDIVTAEKSFLTAIEIGNPWSPYLDLALKSKSVESKDFLVSLYKIVLTKPEIAGPVERKLMTLLWKTNLLEEGNALQKRLGSEAVPPVEELPQLSPQSAGKLKDPNNTELPPGHP
jgi:tetratricopeptide (TPR) repeat protein